jgi:hypothetical protein
MKRLLIVFALVTVAATSMYYERDALSTADYSDPLRYERLLAAGIAVDYLKEPVVAWKIVSGPKKLELTGGGGVLTCIDEHLLLGHPFEAPQQPATIGEALDRCKGGKRE